MNVMKKFRTSELAKIAGIHPNTVRLYEKFNLISSVEREKNNYRIYTEKHFYQIKICRCIYDYAWIGKKFRKESDKIIKASVKWELREALKISKNYLKMIKQELKNAEKTAITLENWAKKEKISNSLETYDRKQAAEIIGTTPESIRNWERNGLIKVPRIGPNKKRIYTELEIDRLRIIYMLLQSKYSISAIRNGLKEYDLGNYENILTSLNTPNTFGLEDASWICVGDQWVKTLKDNISGAIKLIEILKEAMKKNL
jgi:DNA-binding transcriptional MerR regulator